MKGQSAIEFLSIYGFSLIIIVVVAAFLYLYLTTAQNAPATQCTFSGYITCRDMVLGSNSIGTRAVFLFVNPQEYSIENPSAAINITGVGFFSGGCNPNFILPGGAIECVINLNSEMATDQLTSGSAYLNATVCSQATLAGCAGPIAQSYGGSFTTHVSPLVPPPGCSISLSLGSPTAGGIGFQEQASSIVKVLNLPVAGATVNFSTATSGVTITPRYSNTDSNGNTMVIASSPTATSANIMASFGNCTTTQQTTFSTILPDPTPTREAL